MSDAQEKVYKALAGTIEIRDDSGHTAKLSGGVGTIQGFVEAYERMISEDLEVPARCVVTWRPLPNPFHI